MRWTQTSKDHRPSKIAATHLSNKGLSIQLSIVLPGLNGSTKDDELSPPLRVSLHNGINRVGRSNIVAIKQTEPLWPNPSNGGKHGRTAIGKFSLAGVVGRQPLVQAPRVVLQRKIKRWGEKGSKRAIQKISMVPCWLGTPYVKPTL